MFCSPRNRVQPSECNEVQGSPAAGATMVYRFFPKANGHTRTMHTQTDSAHMSLIAFILGGVQVTSLQACASSTFSAMPLLYFTTAYIPYVRSSMAECQDFATSGFLSSSFV
jgi:hypothetical protein